VHSTIRAWLDALFRGARREGPRGLGWRFGLPSGG